MRYLVRRIVPLVATAVVLVSAGSAVAATQSASSAEATSTGCVSFCFDILNDLQMVDNLNAAEVVAICPGLSVLQLSMLSIGQVTNCWGGPPGWKVKRIA
jgi:hypothetical protein